MATKEQIEVLKGYLCETDPAEIFKRLDQRQAGMEALLRFLFETDQTVTAGMISDVMGVSTARVAVLLRKMSEKGLITKETHARDARVTVVRLTKLGEEQARKKQEEVERWIGAAVDKVGMERMLEFARISKEIRSIPKDPEA